MLINGFELVIVRIVKRRVCICHLLYWLDDHIIGVSGENLPSGASNAGRRRALRRYCSLGAYRQGRYWRRYRHRRDVNVPCIMEVDAGIFVVSCD